ncbi:MAG: asparagine synthase (glutamine-hydrolyzing) [Cytophagia bacterium]|nr:asparagine synthase (glutamine-hydrolyzing) [Cytophagia bacterium]
MCGLAGFINFKNGADLVNMVNKVQAHRGPDSKGSWSDDIVHLAHQRLSIIDLDPRSDQPMEKDGLVLIFNGEIYNYKAIKAELVETHNLTFITESDSEVVLEAFRVWGPDCLKRFRGMFAFAIYNKENRRIFLARDHFGIKPLFYTQLGNKLAFASELKSLTVVPGFDKTINKKALVESLQYLWIAGSHTYFKNTFKLPPAHYMWFDGSEVHLFKYWEIPNVTDKPSNEDELINDLRKVLEDSIAHHMVSDVPVSSFLSGGLDSSLISVMAQKHNPNISTYTIGTKEEDKKIEQMPEDEKYARKLADLKGFDYNEITLSADIVNDLPRIVRTLDEPIGDPAAINTFLICSAARKKGVKVILSGMGADEIYLGYRRQKATLMALKYKKLPVLIRTLIRFGVSVLPVKVFGKGFRLARWAKKFLTFAELSVEEGYRQSYSYYNQQEINELLLGESDKLVQEIYRDHRNTFDSKFKGDIPNQMCHTDINMFMMALNLTYSDRASMSTSVEIRVPFIDVDVVQHAMKIPGKWKYERNESKYVLKRAAEKYLPKEIIYRPKASFGAPIRSWISGELVGLIDDLLSRESIQKRGIFNHDYVWKMIDEDRKGIKDHAYRIYQLITIEIWMREFLDN